MRYCGVSLSLGQYVICTLIFAEVTIEVPDHRLPHLGADDITGIAGFYQSLACRNII